MATMGEITDKRVSNDEQAKDVWGGWLREMGKSKTGRSHRNRIGEFPFSSSSFSRVSHAPMANSPANKMEAKAKEKEREIEFI